MLIWIVKDGEHGPYERDEVFQLLAAGEVSNNDSARIDGEQATVSVKEALRRSGSLFTFDQIVAQEEEISATADLVPLISASTRTRANETDYQDAQNRKPRRPATVPLARIFHGGRKKVAKFCE